MGEMTTNKPGNQMDQNKMTAPSTPPSSAQSSSATGSSGVVRQAKDAATHVAGQAKDLVSGQITHQQEKSAGDLGNVAKVLRETSHKLDGNIASPYVEKAADQVERASTYLRNANLDEIKTGVESFARREPLLFLGAAFALGILGARFLKSSANHPTTSGTGPMRTDPTGTITQRGTPRLPGSTLPGGMGRP